MTNVHRVTSEISTPRGAQIFSIEVEDVPTRLAELVPIAQMITDAYLEASIARERDEGRELSCKAGCGVCCRQYVVISIPEALHIAEMVQQLPEHRQQLYSERMTAIAERLVQEGMIDRVLDPTTDPDTILQLPRDFFRLGIDCPFLIDESCSIYPHRPTPCRDHNLTSPAELCRDPYSNPLVKVPSPLPLSALFARLTTDRIGMPPTLVPLAQVLRWVDDHPDLAAQTWPGVELVKDFLTRLNQLDS